MASLQQQSNSTPLIGITTSFESKSDSQPALISLNADYVSAIERAGGVPVVIPVMTSLETMQIAISHIHGLVIPGGPGITEGLVGDLPDDLPPAAPERTQSDRLAFEAAVEYEIPILGICYGMQFINSRLGGTIYGNVETQLGIRPHHHHQTEQTDVEHPVNIEPNTHLNALIGQAEPVNSYHVQAIQDLGKGLRKTISSEDGLVEGFESVDGQIVGVQFHPERMADTVWDSLFHNLVNRVREHTRVSD